jgi:ribosomal protein S8
MTYIKFIILYQQNSLSKKKYYSIYINKKTKKILQKFIELGLIKYTNTNKKNNKLIYIYVNYTKNMTVFKKIKILYKLSKKQNINTKTLLIKKELKSNSTLLLLTSKGILTNFEAIDNNIGGVLLCQINY